MHLEPSNVMHTERDFTTDETHGVVPLPQWTHDDEIRASISVDRSIAATLPEGDEYRTYLENHCAARELELAS